MPQHTVCDGTGNLLFYSILAEHISTATAGQPPDPLSDTAISILDRKRVIDPEADVKLDQFPDWKLVQDRDAFLNPCDYDLESSPPVQFATYFISEKRLEELRQRLSSDTGHGPNITEAVCAFLWKHVVKARNIDCEQYPETKLSVTVNTRPNMRNPICSPVYWGNLSEPNAVSLLLHILRVSSWPLTQSMLQVARMPTRQFCEEPSIFSMHLPHSASGGDTDSSIVSADLATEIFEPAHVNAARERAATLRPLSIAASRIKQAIAAVDSTAVRRLVGLLNQMDKATSLTWNVDRWPGPDMLIVCLHGSKFNHIDFGTILGCSEASRFTVGKPDGKPDGRCFIWPPRHRDGKGIEVMLQYDVETLQRLKACGEFREFFEWRN